MEIDFGLQIRWNRHIPEKWTEKRGLLIELLMHKSIKRIIAIMMRGDDRRTRFRFAKKKYLNAANPHPDLSYN